MTAPAIADRRHRPTVGPMTRRQWLGGAIGAIGTISLRPARADSARLQQVMAEYTGGQTVRPGRIELTLPAIVENGNSVPVTVHVPSPMTEQDHVRRIAVFTEKNPSPQVLQVELGPWAGRAQVSFRMRMADSQTIMAVAQMSDGSHWSVSVEVVVALAACLE